MEYSSSPEPTPDSEGDEYSIRAVASNTGNGDQKGSTRSTRSRDYPKIQASRRFKVADQEQ